MKTISLNKEAVTLTGEAIKIEGKTIKLNELVANALLSSKTKDAMRKLKLARAIYENGDMELEDNDYKMVIEVLNAGNNTALIVGQILEAMGVTE